MKIIFILVALAVSLTLPSCCEAGDWKFYVLGVDLDRIKEGGWSIVALGAVSSLISHRLGHMGYERIASDDTRGYGRAGFALQSAVGLALTSFKATRHTSFTRGWVGWTDLQLALEWDGDDFNYDGHRDYNFFCTVAVYNTLRTSF